MTDHLTHPLYNFFRQNQLLGDFCKVHESTCLLADKSITMLGLPLWKLQLASTHKLSMKELLSLCTNTAQKVCPQTLNSSTICWYKHYFEYYVYFVILEWYDDIMHLKVCMCTMVLLAYNISEYCIQFIFICIFGISIDRVLVIMMIIVVATVCFVHTMLHWYCAHNIEDHLLVSKFIIWHISMDKKVTL